MSQYSAIKAATNAYIKSNGMREITGAILNSVMIATINALGKYYQFAGVADRDTDPGSPDENVIYITGTTGTYANFGGIVVNAGEMALLKWDGTWTKQVIKIIPESTSQLLNDSGFINNAVGNLLNYYLKSETYTKGQVDDLIAAVHQFEFVVADTLPTASADTMYKIYLIPAGDSEEDNYKDEYVTILEDGVYSWEKIGSTAVDLSDYPTNEQMAQAIDDAIAAYISSINASVDSNVGTPSVDVSYSSGVLTLAFHNLKGVQGDPGEQGPPGVTSVSASVDNNTGIPSVEASVNAGMLTLTFHNLKGLQGDTGSSVAYPFTLVNNTTTDDPLQALTAAMGKYLQDQITQLEAKLYSFGGLLVPLLKKIVYKDKNAESYINAIDVLLNSNEIESISAVYTQPGVIYAGEPLEDLEDGLVVTAHFSSGDDVVVASGYELSGSLTAGTSTITVTYLELTATFNVSVTDDVYYKTGDLLPVQVGLRNSIDTAAGLETSYAVNGVQYIFSSAFATGGNATTKKRCAYYLFDILLTAGKTYKHTIEFDSLPANNDILCSLAYYDETYHLAGVANVKQTCNYSANVTAPAGWVSATKNGNVVSFDEQVPTGYVGARLSMKMAISGTDKDWPTTLTVKRYIIQEIE